MGVWLRSRSVIGGTLVVSLLLGGSGRVARASDLPRCEEACTATTACGTPCLARSAGATCGSHGPTCTEEAVKGRKHLFRFRMLTLNTWLLTTPLGIGAAPDRSCRARQIGDRLAGRFYDVVVLQEGFDRGAVDALIARAGYPHHYSRYPRPRGVEKSGGLAVLSLFPVSFQHNEPWDDACGPDALAQKGFFHARLRHPSMDSPLDLVTLHLNANYGDPFGFRAVRRNQATQLADELARYPSSTLLVAGDFNVIGPPALPGDHEDNAEYEGMLETILPPTMREAWVVKRPAEPGFTADDCTNSYREGCRDDSAHRSRIDMIWYDDRRNCYELELVDVFVDEFREGPGQGCPRDHLSDHFGVGAVFDVWRKPASDWAVCLPPDPDQPDDVR
jgi:endonuclease/exonuclease/phosphatase family metal-dependent hydrolase